MYDLVVIGGGSGGLSVARSAARVGARVALVERGRPGGEGGLGACVPSKGLVQAAKLLRQVKAAGEFGIRAGAPTVDFAAVMARVRQASDAIAAADSDEALKARGIDVLHGSASFEAYDTILLDGKTRVEGQRFVVATGSRPTQLWSPGLAEARPLDSTTLWTLAAVPESLVVLGAGPVALEFAQVFARFGAKVTVLTHHQSVLPREDPEVAGTVACILTGEGITFHRGATVTEVERRDGRKVVHYKDEGTGQAGEVAAAEILCAEGRLANVEGLNLEAIGVHADPIHGIEVDELLQTHAVRVFAVGDVLLRNQFAHAAEREAEVAFQNAVLRRRRKMDYSTLPWATFVDPEVATVGLTEDKAKAEEVDHRVYRVPYEDLDRGRIEGRTEGFAKVVASPSGKILGATIVGEEASLVLQQLVVAMDGGLGLGDLADVTQIYPTYGRIIHDLAAQYRATRRGRGFLQSALNFFYGFQPQTPAGPVETPDGDHDHEEPGHHAEPATTAHGH
jgi:pyruvate/2-oxoglutarate dehydrogenase complex dihydrolipoamide dehydrogenase (E3) component